MDIAIQERKGRQGRSSLYLEIKADGQRKKETLHLFIYDFPNGKLQELENKRNRELAEHLRAKRLLELQDTEFGLNRVDNSGKNFIEFFEKKSLERFNNSNNYHNWRCVGIYLRKFYGETLLMKHLTTERAKEFKLYLKNKARTNRGLPLAQNSQYSYFNKFKCCLKLAYKEKLLKENISEDVEGFSQGETFREFLTLEELQKLIQTECRFPMLKQAFLFACLTGLRWSDIVSIKWKSIRERGAGEYEISHRQSKTGSVELLPISLQAYELLGKRSYQDDHLFANLKYSAYNNTLLQDWVSFAGIQKRISFHCSRHTHACLLIDSGVDLYTVSKLLGHKHIQTTQIYAKVGDRKRVEAVNRIPLLNFSLRK